MNGESYEARRMLKSISTATTNEEKRIEVAGAHGASEDRENCLALAQLYQNSWNTLRDHEWRLEITLWATFLIVIGVLFCGNVKALGIEISAPKSIADDTKNLIVYGLISIAVVVTIGSYGMQMAFRHFEKLRDDFVGKATRQPSDKLYDWTNPQRVCGIPWHSWNTLVSVASTAIVTGFLVWLTWVLLGNLSDPRFGQQYNTKTIKARIKSVTSDANKRTIQIYLDDGSELLARSTKTDELKRQFVLGEEIEARVNVSDGVKELRSATIRKSEKDSVELDIDIVVLPSRVQSGGP